MNYTLKTTTENNVIRYLLCDTEQNYYVINRLLHDILHEYQNTQNISEICTNLNKNSAVPLFTESFVAQSLEKAKEFIFKASTKNVENKRYIKHRVRIIKEGQLQSTYKILSLLFHKFTFLFISIIAIVVTVSFFYKNGFTDLHLLSAHLIATSSIGNLTIAFLFYLSIALIHEIGHATATFKCKIQPKEIGAGLYFIFPVLYTNVTNVWELPALKRMIVNLGGIYFQLIINCILILFHYFNLFNNITILLIVFNTVSILVAFNPFFRYDGYWLFSDFFGISNLREKSTAFITNAINYPTKINGYIKINKTKTATIIYSLLNIAFWAWVYVSITNYLIKNIPESISLIFIKEEFSLMSIFTMLNCLLILVWVFTAIKTIYITISKNTSHAK